MLRLIAALILLQVAGCGGLQPSIPPPQKATGSLPARNQHAELENVARCFHEAVTVLQAEPDTPDHLAMFMKEAKAAVDESGRGPTRANFDALRWNSDSTWLITTSGERIRCRVVKQIHDNYGSRGTAWFTEYEFYIPDSEHSSRTTIELRMR